jgi:uncharacterized cupredoxin-like copper-binding protein
MKTKFFTIATMLMLALVSQHSLAGPGGNAVGKPGVVSKATRTINVDMKDNMRFTPANINVKQGETVRFVIKNSGVLKHEFVLGSDADLKKHYAMMMKDPSMAHSDSNMITLDGGKTGEIIWEFTNAGKVEFGCLQPGHFDAGMKGEVDVIKK